MHILANRNLTDTTGDLAGCEPTFTLRCEETPFIPGINPNSPSGIERICRRRADLISEDLNRIADKYHLVSSDTLLINSLRHWSLDGVVEWLESLERSQAPVVVLVLHYTPFPQPGVPDPAASSYCDAFKRIVNSPVSERIVLCTDSERLAAEYKSLFDIPITVLPIPHCPRAALDERNHGDRLTIAFAGEARRDKGFHLLPYVIRKILAQEAGRNPIFSLQAYYSRPGEEICLTARANLPVSDDVRIISEPLSETEYEAFIKDADLILIPYLRDPYHAQTSGVYCEAAALGTPVVVPSGTWMADQVVKNGGGILFESGDADSLAMACLEAIRSYSTLRESARRAAPAWRAFHDATNYIGRLEALLQDLQSGC